MYCKKSYLLFLMGMVFLLALICVRGTNFINMVNEFAKKAVYESSVLLKNDEILPIDESKKIAVIGPYVDEIGLDALWSDIVKQRN